MLNIGYYNIFTFLYKEFKKKMSQQQLYGNID